MNVSNYDVDHFIMTFDLELVVQWENHSLHIERSFYGCQGVGGGGGEGGRY